MKRPVTTLQSGRQEGLSLRHETSSSTNAANAARWYDAELASSKTGRITVVPTRLCSAPRTWPPFVAPAGAAATSTVPPAGPKLPGRHGEQLIQPRSRLRLAPVEPQPPGHITPS